MAWRWRDGLMVPIDDVETPEQFGRVLVRISPANSWRKNVMTKSRLPLLAVPSILAMALVASPATVDWSRLQLAANLAHATDASWGIGTHGNGKGDGPGGLALLHGEAGAQNHLPGSVNLTLSATSTATVRVSGPFTDFAVKYIGFFTKFR